MREKKSTKEDLVELLNQALRLEYTLIVHYPRITSEMPAGEARDKSIRLGQDSVKHADIVASAITDLGGRPVFAFDPPPLDMELVELFQKQLEKEKLAFSLHHQCAGMASDFNLKSRLLGIADEEAVHIQLVKDILADLGAPVY